MIAEHTPEVSRHQEPVAGARSVAMPLVDVGIPTIGSSPYLAEAVESVLAQTVARWRLVIRENGPGLDSVREALEPYLDDPRIVHVVSGARRGRGENWTSLIRTGDAPYVGLLHDDDRWAPRFLERRIEFLEQNHGCGYVCSGYVVIDQHGQPKGRVKPKIEPGVHRSEQILPELYRDNFVGVTTVLVRRAAYEAIGSTFKEHWNLDHEMWMRLAASFDVGCLDTWDADYRHHPAQTSTARNQLGQKHLESLDLVADLPIAPSLRKQVRALSHVRCALDAIERGERREAAGHLRQSLRTDHLLLLRPSASWRLLAATAALVAGSRGRRAVARSRQRRWESGNLVELNENAGR
jgi:hypothetical protein